MKLLKIFLVSGAIISTMQATITVKNETPYTISVSLKKWYGASGRKLKQKGYGFTLQPKESNEFSDAIYLHYNLYAQTENHPEIKSGIFKIPNERFAKLLRNPRHNLVVPITVEKTGRNKQAEKKLKINIPNTVDELYDALRIVPHRLNIQQEAVKKESEGSDKDLEPKPEKKTIERKQPADKPTVEEIYILEED